MIDSREAQTSWRHIWQLSWPIMLSNITVPLVGAVDVAVMGRLDDPVSWRCRTWHDGI